MYVYIAPKTLAVKGLMMMMMNTLMRAGVAMDNEVTMIGGNWNVP